ncbi:MAG: hypothetical protein U0528_12570 [Anaerolineae bacterium]
MTATISSLGDQTFGFRINNVSSTSGTITSAEIHWTSNGSIAPVSIEPQFSNRRVVDQAGKQITCRRIRPSAAMVEAAATHER